MLWTTGAITVEAVKESRKSKNKVVVLKPVLNKATGKVSASALAFNEANWGAATRSYATSARKNLDSDSERFLKIMEMSRVFMKGKYINRHRESTIDIEDDDPRANLVDLVEKPESPDENEGTT